MKLLTLLRLTFTATLLIGTASCRQASEPVPNSATSTAPSPSNGVAAVPLVSSNSAATAPATNQQIYLVKGLIKEVMPEKNKIRIAHEAIPDYMEAMTMVFEVKDAKELAKAQAGDSVRFRMIVTEDDGWIDNIVKMEPGEVTSVVPETSTPEGFRRVREVEPLREGDLLPDYQFTNQLGQAVRLQDFKGQVLAFSFVYTRCPFPTFCPRISGNMAAAHQKQKGMEGGLTNWHFMSITIDPDYDTPAVLANYGRQYHADPKRWSFVTGPLIDVTAIAEQFGLMFWRSDPTKPLNIDHNLRTVIIGPDGRVKKIMTENAWKADDLVTNVLEAAKG